MNRKVLKFSRKLILILCLSLVLFSYAGCALFTPVFKLIGFTLELPFRVLAMAFQLLPYVIRYAPLALLLVDNQKPNADYYYAKLSPNAKKISLQPGLDCYILDVSQEDQLEAVAQLAVENRDHLLFMKHMELPASKEFFLSLYEGLEKNQLYLAYDSRLEFSTSDPKKLHNV